MSANFAKTIGLVAFLALVGILGCTGGTTPGQNVAQSEANTGTPPLKIDDPFLPPSPDMDDEEDKQIEEELNGPEMELVQSNPEKGTAEWLVREILQIRLKPLPEINSPDEEVNGQKVDPALIQKQVEANTAARQERNREIIKLATQAIAMTHQDPEKERVFSVAVHHLLDSHFQLALEGDKASVDSLYDAAAAFQEKRPGSEAAKEAAMALVNLAHMNAGRYGETEPRWFREFARQAHNYATNFPTDQAKALPILLTAARTAEVNDFYREAAACYSLAEVNFPDAEEVTQLAGVMRRINLEGKPLQLAGPSALGNAINIEDYKGKAVLVVFWASQVQAFGKDVEALKAVGQKYSKYLQVVGVNLDGNETDMDAFLEKAELTWPQIFYAEPEKRGWNSPLAEYYGISVLPTVWLVDPKGVVVDTHITADTAGPKVLELLKKHFQPGGKPAPQN